MILAALDLAHEDVPVPEWGGTVRIKTMTGAARDAFEASLVQEGGKRDFTNLRARLLAHAIVGEDDQPVFSAADVDALGQKSAAALDRLYDVAQRLNGIGTTAQADAEKK